jgi:hypothetical protein
VEPPDTEIAEAIAWILLAAVIGFVAFLHR